MKLLVVGGKWPPETFIARRLEGLARAGFHVTLACHRSGERGQRLAGVRWMPLPVWSGSWLRRGWDLLGMLAVGLLRAPGRTWRILRLACASKGAARWRKLHRLLPFACQKPDWLHFEWNFAAVQYLELADLLGCPMIVSCRGSHVQVAPHNPERAADAAALPLTFEKAAAIHCVSQAMQREVEAMGGARGKTHIITPAVDPNVFCPPAGKQKGKTLRIIMTSSVIWPKGYEYALLALRELLDRGVDARLTLVGGADKANRQRLLYTIEDLDLANRVHWAGSLTPAQVVKELQQSDVFLLTSVSEGISNAVLEAMACGLPVVTTDCGGMEEAVTDGVEGFVTPVRDPLRAADALQRLALDEPLRLRMGQAARARILREFQLSQQIDKWVSLYQRLRREVASSSPVSTGAPAGRQPGADPPLASG